MTEGRRVVLAGLIGNVMEWYDFAVYGYFAAVIAPQFFPSSSPVVSLIAAFGAFAAGFLVRPLGGLVFGRIGDLFGRRRALMVSIMAMAVPTVLIGCLPNYDAIGVFAPILLILLRIVQGLSVGGEYTSSLIFLAEHAPPDKRAVTAVWGTWGAVAGILLGSGVGAVVAALVDAQQLASWGWRIPFLFGAAVAGTGILIRRAIRAAPSTGERGRPVLDTFTVHRWAVAKVALLNIGYGVGFYAAFVYAVTYIRQIDNLDESTALNLNTMSMAALLLILPMAAWLTDRIGRKPMVVAGSAILALGAIPFFQLMHHPEPGFIILGELGFVLGVGALGGGLAAANFELIPAPIRCTGLAIAYNAAIGWFGGTTPLMATWLIANTEDPIAPAYWLAATASVSLFAGLFLMKETLPRQADRHG